MTHGLAGYRRIVKHEMQAEYDGDLGARVEDVAQQAIEAVATTYTNDPDIDVEEHLRMQLSSRGIRAANEDWIAEAAQEIRSGHHVRTGQSDGPVDGL